jgi:hypothetical protein
MDKSQKVKYPNLPSGTSNFEEIITKNYYYVDKTLLIKDIWHEGSVILVTRPRRFGKTLNLDMIRCFFEISDKNKKPLFNNLAISNEPEFMTMQGTYPVIYLTFKDIKEKSWEKCFNALMLHIINLFKNYMYILEKLPDYEKDQIEMILKGEANEALYSSSIGFLTKYLHNYYQKRVILLIDEYDTPILSAYKHGYYDEAINFFRNLLSKALKDNNYLEKGVLTGILRVAKESIFSGLNNLKVFSLIDSKLSDKFGFTEKEISLTLDKFGLSDRKKEVDTWYNGYSINRDKLYNPFSIIEYLNDRKAKAFWINSSANEIVYDIVAGKEFLFQENLKKLMNEGVIEAEIDENIIFYSFHWNREAVWTILFFSGYLTLAGEVNADLNRYRLTIPNKEVLLCFKQNISKWINNTIGSNKLSAMLTALTDGNIERFNELLQHFVKTMLSYYDTAGEAPEGVYQAFFLGLLINLENQYKIRSNRESGYGRYDIMMFPKDINQTGIIIEFKKVRKNESSEDVLKAALNQIKKKEYAAELKEAGIEKILAIAVALKGKKVEVKAERIELTSSEF